MPNKHSTFRGQPSRQPWSMLAGLCTTFLVFRNERPAKRGRASIGYNYGTDRGRKRANDDEQGDRRRRQQGMTAEALLTTL
jgi:hypothetical protein